MNKQSGATAPKVIPVYVVVPPHILLLDVAGPVEVLRRANAEQQDILFDYHFVST
ncbi:GlxA family transcriptional regulator, partial [Ochrobactrum sp. MR28]|nr:GlxA family transcriptional regulator [Ochrobactrum sp. MR28]